MRFRLAILSLLLPLRLLAATYYVDFDGESDASAGTSTGTAWKHCKGDPNATGTAASTTPAAGDTIYFKGGVVYRGAISVASGGTVGNPIIYDGRPSGWGTGNAILDGSTNISTSWTRCISPADAGGNANWTNIWWTTVPAGVSNCLPPLFINGTNNCHWSQDPTPSDFIFWEDLDEFRTNLASGITLTNLTDPVRLTNASSTFFDGSFAGVWVSGNSIEIQAITNLNTTAKRIDFGGTMTHQANGYLDDSYPGRYTIIGNLAYVDTPGEWCVRTNENRLYLWALGSVDPNTVTVSIGGTGNAFNSIGNANVTFRNFQCRGFYQPLGAAGYSGMFVNSGDGAGASHNITVSSNEVYLMRSFNAAPVIYLQSGSNMVAQGNYIHDTTLSRGIILGYPFARAIQNRISRINGTGIYFPGVVNGVIISNTITDLNGIHGNGISVYTGCTNVIVAYNSLSNNGLAITSQTSHGLKFYNNLIDVGAATDSSQVQIDYDYYGTFFVNNTFCRIPASPVGIGFVSPTYGRNVTNAWDDVTNVFQGNIYWGLPAGSNNIIMYYNSNLDGSYSRAGYYPNNFYTNQATLFNAIGDWTLKPGTVAIDNQKFDFRSVFTDDIYGANRGAPPWNLGAIEGTNGASGFLGVNGRIQSGFNIKTSRRGR